VRSRCIRDSGPTSRLADDVLRHSHAVVATWQQRRVSKTRGAASSHAGSLPPLAHPAMSSLISACESRGKRRPQARYSRSVLIQLLLVSGALSTGLEGIVPCVELDLSSAASHLPGSLEYLGSGAPCSRRWRALLNRRACRAQYLDFIALPYADPSPRLRSSRSPLVLAHHRETPDLRACDFASLLWIVRFRAILLRRTLGRDLRAYRGSLYVLPACSSLRCRGSRSCIGLSPFSALSAPPLFWRALCIRIGPSYRNPCPHLLRVRPARR
jgi:hypothetical protein